MPSKTAVPPLVRQGSTQCHEVGPCFPELDCGEPSKKEDALPQPWFYRISTRVLTSTCLLMKYIGVCLSILTKTGFPTVSDVKCWKIINTDQRSEKSMCWKVPFRFMIFLRCLKVKAILLPKVFLIRLAIDRTGTENCFGLSVCFSRKIKILLQVGSGLSQNKLTYYHLPGAI